MKDYLNFEGLTHFFEKLLDKITTLLESKVDKEDVVEITEAEVDEICGSEIIAEDVSV